MKVEVLFIDGCPNHPPAVARVREVLAEEKIRTELLEVEVKDEASAWRIGFLGSPSVRIDGRDVEHDARAACCFGMMCRTYTDGDRRVGVPPAALIRSAVREATRRKDL